MQNLPTPLPNPLFTKMLSICLLFSFFIKLDHLFKNATSEFRWSHYLLIISIIMKSQFNQYRKRVKVGSIIVFLVINSYLHISISTREIKVTEEEIAPSYLGSIAMEESILWRNPSLPPSLVFLFSLSHLPLLWSLHFCCPH